VVGEGGAVLGGQLKEKASNSQSEVLPPRRTSSHAPHEKAQEGNITSRHSQNWKKSNCREAHRKGRLRQKRYHNVSFFYRMLTQGEGGESEAVGTGGPLGKKENSGFDPGKRN